MRRNIALLIIGVTILSALPAFAELENVMVGGQIRIRGRYWSDAWAGNVSPVARLPLGAFNKRALGRYGVDSLYDFDDRGADLKFVEQRTTVNVQANFTDNVTAYIELSDYARWGEDFRSDYVTGLDARANTADDVEVVQAYIDMKDVMGYPVSARIGRQELKFGKSWLVGSEVSPTQQITYDAIRLTWNPMDDLVVDGWWSKLAENSPAEQDGDIDFYGVYATYSGIEALSLSAYWLWVRDAVARADTYPGWFGNWIEDVLGLDDYDVTNLHTVGLRAFGKSAGFDYDLELAYQFGESGAAGSTFLMPAIFGVYGDDDAEYSTWAGDLEAGYTFDYTCSPRIYIGGAYYGGEDNRDLSFWDWVNPCARAESSLSFNRLFSGIWYNSMLDIVGGASDLTNFWQVRLGMTANATAKISTGAQVAYLGVVEPFDWPTYFTSKGLFGFPDARIAILPQFAWWTREADDEIGWITHLWTKYQYSADLFVRIGWEHLFTGDGLEDGSYLKRNGFMMLGGTDDDDCDYFYFDMGLKF